VIHVDGVDTYECHRLARQLGEAPIVDGVEVTVLVAQVLVVRPRVVVRPPPCRVEQVDVMICGRADAQLHQERVEPVARALAVRGRQLHGHAEVGDKSVVPRPRLVGTHLRRVAGHPESRELQRVPSGCRTNPK